MWVIITMFELLLKAAENKQPSEPKPQHTNNHTYPLTDNQSWRISPEQTQTNTKPEKYHPERLRTNQPQERKTSRQINIKLPRKDYQFVQGNDFSEEDQYYQLQISKKNSRLGGSKLKYLRMRDAVSELKQTQFDLFQYLEDQRRFMEDFHQRLCLDIEDFIMQYLTKAAAETNKAQLRELESAKNALELQNKTIRKANSREENLGGKCSSCRILQSSLAQSNSQLKKSEQEIEKLLIENQQLQETIFDIEQKLAGVDLEVERRLSQKLMTLPELKQETTNNTAQVQKYKQEIRVLEVRCRKFEQNARMKAELDAQIQKLQQRQRELNAYQANIKDLEQRLQQVKQANYERESQILQAQKNLSKKVHDLRQKEGELSRWEAELTRTAGEVRNMTLQASIHNDQASYRAKSIAQLQNSREMSLKSFGKTPQEMSHEQLQPKLSPRTKNYQGQYTAKVVRQPQREYQPHRQYYENRYQVGKRKEGRPIVENQYAIRNREQYNNPAKKPTYTTNYRQNRQTSPYHNVVEQRGRIIQHTPIPQNVPHYRDLSKGSRHSAAKSIKSAYGGNANAVKVRNQGQLNGLGSKLQRLRQQIKKEIQSIK